VKQRCCPASWAPMRLMNARLLGGLCRTRALRIPSLVKLVDAPAQCEGVGDGDHSLSRLAVAADFGRTRIVVGEVLGR